MSLFQHERGDNAQQIITHQHMAFSWFRAGPNTGVELRDEIRDYRFRHGSDNPRGTRRCPSNRRQQSKG